jgi:hypothetical protein
LGRDFVLPRSECQALQSRVVSLQSIDVGFDPRSAGMIKCLAPDTLAVKYDAVPRSSSPAVATGDPEDIVRELVQAGYKVAWGSHSGMPTLSGSGHRLTPRGHLEIHGLGGLYQLACGGRKSANGHPVFWGRFIPSEPNARPDSGLPPDMPEPWRRMTQDEWVNLTDDPQRRAWAGFVMGLKATPAPFPRVAPGCDAQCPQVIIAGFAEGARTVVWNREEKGYRLWSFDVVDNVALPAMALSQSRARSLESSSLIESSRATDAQELALDKGAALAGGAGSPIRSR